MPQIIVKADEADGREDAVMLKERVNVSDFETDSFGPRLIERLGWAVNDADQVEKDRNSRNN